MARNQRKPSERSSKTASLKVNVKGSGKVKKQSKDVKKVTKTKATIKCSKCSKVISGKNSKVKMCASCLKNIANLAKKKPAPPSKPKPLQNSKIKAPNKKANARARTYSNKNNPVTANILLNSKTVKSPSKAPKSPKKTASKRTSNDGEIAKNNKHQSPVNIKSDKKVSPQSGLSLGGKMGLRGKKRSYVQLASGADDENKTKKLKTSKADIPKVRGTRNKKPTPKASEWLSNISPKRKSPQKEKSKVETKSKSPKIKSISKTPSNSKKSVSPSKSNAGKKESTPSSARKKIVKRLSNIKGDNKQPSPVSKNKVKTTPSTTKTATPSTTKTATPSTTKTATPTRSSTRRSAKFTSDTVQKKTRNSSVKPLSRAVKTDKSVQSSNADLKDGVVFAKEILEDILISVANDSEISLFTNTNDSQEDINPHIDSTETLENNMVECADDSTEKELQLNVVTCEKGHDASATDDIELHLSPEKDIELHISPKTAVTEMDIVKTEMDINDYQGKDKVHKNIKEKLEFVDLLKRTESENLEIDLTKVDNKCDESPKKHKLQEIATNICISDDGHKTPQGHRSISADDKPREKKLETKQNGPNKSLSHHSSENIGEITNLSPLDNKNEMPVLPSSPLSVKISQNSTHFNTDSSNSFNILDSTKQINHPGKNFQSSVSASEVKNNCNELLQQKNLDVHSENKSMCNQALNEPSSEEIFNSNENKAPALKCLSEQNGSLGSSGKCCAENNFSSSGHEENDNCKAISTEDANKCSQSQSLSNVSPNVHSTTYLRTLKSSSTDTLNEKSKAFHIQDTFNEQGGIHCPTTKNEEQINAEVKLDETFNSCSRQDVLTVKNENVLIENSDDDKTDREVSALITDSNNPNTGHDVESSSTVDIDECKVINDEVLPTLNCYADENERNGGPSLKYDKPNTEIDVIIPDNVPVNDGEDSTSRDNVELPTTDGEDYLNENGKVPSKDSDAYKTGKLVSTSLEDSKNQIDDVLLTNDYEKSEDCMNKSALLLIKDTNNSDEVLQSKDPNHHKSNSDELLPTKELENNVLKYDTDKQRLLTSESDGLLNEVNDSHIVDVAPLIIDSNHKSSLSESVKQYFDTNVDDKVTSVTGDSRDEQVEKTEEPSCHKQPKIEERKTTQSDQSGLFNQFGTKLDEDQTKEELPHQKEQLPQIAEHKAQSDQKEICKNELKTDDGETEKEQSYQQEQSSQKGEYKTTRSGIFDSEIETKLDEEKTEEEPPYSQNKELAQIEVYKTKQSNQSGILPSKIELKTDEHKAEEYPLCKKEQLPQVKEYKTTQSDLSKTLSNNIEIKLSEDKTEEEPPFCQKAQSPQIEQYETTQSDLIGISSSQIEIKTDEENKSNLPLDSEVPVSRIESPMNVDNKTDFENNEPCDELTLKVEETREDCISIDGTDVESMQCNSETRSSNRMSVDEEVITMDIDQDDTAVDGSECQSFGIKVSNELNMEVN